MFVLDYVLMIVKYIKIMFTFGARVWMFGIIKIIEIFTDLFGAASNSRNYCTCVYGKSAAALQAGY